MGTERVMFGFIVSFCGTLSSLRGVEIFWFIKTIWCLECAPSLQFIMGSVGLDKKWQKEEEEKEEEKKKKKKEKEKNL